MISKSVGLQKESGVRLRVFFVNNSNHYQNSKVRQKKKNLSNPKFSQLQFFIKKIQIFVKSKLFFGFNVGNF